MEGIDCSDGTTKMKNKSGEWVEIPQELVNQMHLQYESFDSEEVGELYFATYPMFIERQLQQLLD